ncbi:hypothetical protein L2E82_45072 [Cichorium intybus]|uniref:Uncharacterized protein n=1 Tax=Cichorium intybus TaxID=13427 RepID=A0ACB8ZTB6_CICIN|nr:hypothetical protein L2E82_45072 [Cichorium intybus]
MLEVVSKINVVEVKDDESASFGTQKQRVIYEQCTIFWAKMIGYPGNSRSNRTGQDSRGSQRFGSSFLA